jgi:maltose O-acetyltransferase
MILRVLGPLKARFEQARLEHRWRSLRAHGMRIGESVWLPASTWIDVSHCFLISIGDRCGFGEECMILAHDAQMDEFLDAARLGKVTIHESCHIGARSVILAGVEIGPRTLVGANSVVTKSLPPDTVCAGNPARVICTLQEYLDRHRERIAESPTFPYLDYDIRFVTPEGREKMLNALRDGPGYMLGGHSAELAGRGGTPRTAQGVAGSIDGRVR